jgi:hypothetical protein
MRKLLIGISAGAVVAFAVFGCSWLPVSVWPLQYFGVRPARGQPTSPNFTMSRRLNMAAYATQGDGTIDNPWVGWDDRIRWSDGAIYDFPHGYYRIEKPLVVPANSVTWYCDNIVITDTDANPGDDALVITAQHFTQYGSMNIQLSGSIANAIHIQNGNVVINNPTAYPIKSHITMPTNAWIFIDGRAQVPTSNGIAVITINNPSILATSVSNLPSGGLIEDIYGSDVSINYGTLLTGSGSAIAFHSDVNSDGIMLNHVATDGILISDSRETTIFEPEEYSSIIFGSGGVRPIHCMVISDMQGGGTIVDNTADGALVVSNTLQAKYPLLPLMCTTVAELPSGLPAGSIRCVTDWNGIAGPCAGGGSDYKIAIYSGAAWQCK